VAAGDLKHIVVTQAGRNRLVERTGFVKESVLQALVQASPELLGPLGESLLFLPIGYEVPLSGARRLDLLFLDSEGLLTLIETKLRANDESRREVIGQVLEYALALEAWDAESIRLRFAQFVTSPPAPADLKGLSLSEAAVLRFGWLEDEESERAAKLDALFSKLESNLQRGLLRVVVGVDEHIEGLEKLVQYFSRHSDLQVVLLQVNSFPVEEGLSVLIPSLHGDVGEAPGRIPGSPTARLTLGALLDLFPEGAERSTVADLLKLTESLGASFEPGPSGTSVRIRTSLWPQPVTIAWFFGPGKQGWMRTADLSFGHPLADNPLAPPALVSALEDYFLGIAGLGLGTDASSKGVHAWRMTATDAGLRFHELSERLRAVAGALNDHRPL